MLKKGGHEHARFTGSSSTTAGVLALSAAAATPDETIYNLLLPPALAGTRDSNCYHIIAVCAQFAFTSLIQDQNK